MASHEETIDINASVAETWAVMADVERWPSWTPTVKVVDLLSSGDFGVGSKVRVQQPRLPAVTWTVDKYVPGHSFSWIASSPGVVSEGHHRVDPTSHGCRAVLGFAQSGRLVGLSDLVYRRLIANYVRTEALGLKRYVEQQRG